MNPAKALLILCLAAAPLVPLYASAEININTATIEELKTLDGVGDAIAQSIVANRPYASIEEISRVKGIGAPGSISYEKIKNHISVVSTKQSAPPVVATTTSPVPPAPKVAPAVVTSPQKTVVQKAPQKTPATVAQKNQPIPQKSLAAAPIKTPQSSPFFWISFALLGGLLGAGVAGTHYLSKTRAETPLMADEFEIE